jgi:hypothetical protein
MNFLKNEMQLRQASMDSGHSSTGHSSSGQSGSGYSAELHLDPAQIDQHLIGDPAPAVAAHLAECELCELRVAAAAAPLVAFRAVSLAWGERRSATLPLHHSLVRASTLHPRLGWAAAAVVALAVGVAVPALSHQRQEESARITSHPAAQTAQAVSQRAEPSDSQTPVSEIQVRADVQNSAAPGEQIVRDNQMLKAIDRELDASAESPAVFGLLPVGDTAQGKGRAPSSLQD